MKWLQLISVIYLAGLATASPFPSIFADPRTLTEEGESEDSNLNDRIGRRLDITKNLPEIGDNKMSWTDEDGTYRFGFDAGDHWRSEVRTPDGEVRGSYGYRTPEGDVVITKFSAGVNGYLADTKVIEAATPGADSNIDASIKSTLKVVNVKNTPQDIPGKLSSPSEIKTSSIFKGQNIVHAESDLTQQRKDSTNLAFTESQPKPYGALESNKRLTPVPGLLDEEFNAVVLNAENSSPDDRIRNINFNNEYKGTQNIALPVSLRNSHPVLDYYRSYPNIPVIYTVQEPSVIPVMEHIPVYLV